MKEKKHKHSLRVPMYRPGLEAEMSEPDRIHQIDVYDNDKFWDGDGADEDKG